MDFKNLALFKMAQTKLDWTSQRQTLLAENVANADTPKYKVKDLRRPDFKKMATDAYSSIPEQAITQPGHVRATLTDTGPFQVDTPRQTYETSIDGNKVVLEEQIEQVSRNKSEYNMALSLIQKNMQMLKTALGRGSV